MAEGIDVASVDFGAAGAGDLNGVALGDEERTRKRLH